MVFLVVLVVIPIFQSRRRLVALCSNCLCLLGLLCCCFLYSFPYCLYLLVVWFLVVSLYLFFDHLRLLRLLSKLRLLIFFYLAHLLVVLHYILFLLFLLLVWFHCICLSWLCFLLFFLRLRCYYFLHSFRFQSFHLLLV